MQLAINPELKNIIPPLTSDEYATLEQSILSEGCREPLIVWDGAIVDGHNRYEICNKHNLEFKTQDKSFESLDDAKIWMIDNQKGRRNLTDGWKYELAQVKKGILASKYKENMKLSQGRGQKGIPKTDIPFKQGKTQHDIAQDLNWSTGKTAQADYVWSKADKDPEVAEIKKKAMSGDITINKAYEAVKKNENKQARKEREVNEVKELTTVHARVVQKDCLQVLDDIEEIDLLIADPPYFTDGDFTRHISECLKRVKTTGQAYVFASADPKELSAYLSTESHHMELEQVLVWNYNNTGQRQPNKRYTSNYQVCFYYRGPDAPDINKPADGKEQYACQNINAPDARIGDRYFKWQKPLELMERIIRNSSNEGDFVFDPFVGSGSSVVAAAKLGRKALGCDLNLELINICVERGCKVEESL